MLWYCRFTWNPGTTTDRVRQRVLQQHAAGTNHPECIRGWYNLAGGGAGFLLIDTEDPRDLNTIIEPYMDLVSWDVHGVYELPYAAVTEHFEQRIAAAGKESPEAAMAMQSAGREPIAAGGMSADDEFVLADRLFEP